MAGDDTSLTALGSTGAVMSRTSSEPPRRGRPAVAAVPRPAGLKIEGRSPWRLRMERLLRDRAAIVCLGVIILIVLLAIFAPVVAAVTGHGPNEQIAAYGLTAVGLPRRRARRSGSGPTTWGATSWCGSRTGRGSRWPLGSRPPLSRSSSVRSPGWYPGTSAEWSTRSSPSIMDKLLAFPFLLFAIALVAVVGPSLTVVIGVIGFFGWASVGRIVRGQILSIKERE